MLRRCLHEALDVAPAGEVFADRAQHDHANAVIFIERLEHQPQLVALRHLDYVQRWAIEDDVGPFLLGI